MGRAGRSCLEVPAPWMARPDHQEVLMRNPKAKLMRLAGAIAVIALVVEALGAGFKW
jgi:hypothetical protein